MTEKNPFSYGRVLRPEDPACPRPDLEERILRAFADRDRLALFGDRRLGKSTLVSRTLAIHRHPCIAFDLLGLNSVDGLCAIMVSAIEEHIRQRSALLRRVTPWLREIGLDLRDLRLTLSGGPVRLEFSNARSTDTLRRLLDHIGQLSQRAPLAVFFDEFQEINDRLSKEDARHVLGVLRSVIQRQSRAAYFFAGSAKASFTALFTQEGAPFFEGAQLLEIKPIPEAVFAGFLREQFRRSSRPAVPEAIHAILTLGGERAADVQQLAHESWYAATETPVQVSAVSRALVKIVNGLESTGLALLSSATELQQRALFAAAFFQDSAERQARVAEIARFRSATAYRKALSPFLGGDTPVLEDLGNGRIRFRHHYLRLWCLMQHSRAINLLPTVRDPDYYRALLPAPLRLVLQP